MDAIQQASNENINIISPGKQINPFNQSKCYKTYCVLVSKFITVFFHESEGICIEITKASREKEQQFSKCQTQAVLSFASVVVLLNTTESLRFLYQPL